MYMTLQSSQNKIFGRSKSSVRRIRASHSGGNIGIACMTLGGGRETKDSVIDLSVGIYLKKKNGDAVDTGDTLAVIYANDREKWMRLPKSTACL